MGRCLDRIVQSFTEIYAGYFLNPYFEMKPPVIEQPFRRPDIDGYVVAMPENKDWNGDWSVPLISFILTGEAVTGSSLGISSAQCHPRATMARTYNVPNGLLQIISTQEKTATALVVKSQ